MTIPKVLRERLGLDPGQVLDFQEEAGRLVATKVSVSDPVDTVYGLLPAEPSTDAVITSIRGDSDLP